MFFTTQEIGQLNYLRKDRLHNNEDVYLNNKISRRALFNQTFTQGTRISNTLKSQGDKKGARDVSQYLRLKRGVFGASLLRK